LTCVAALFSCDAAAADDSAQRTFAALTALVGDWEGTYSGSGSTHQVNYRMTAGGSVLVETWTMSPTRESMTMYSVDGDQLVATHYCPQGNQPRLALVGADADGRLQFRFRDGGNLQNPEGSHQHAMWLSLDLPEHFTRSETYVGNAEMDKPLDGEGEAVVYRRLASASKADG
jgi:hypothetical protein